jgi:hypothetical protein
MDRDPTWVTALRERREKAHAEAARLCRSAERTAKAVAKQQNLISLCQHSRGETVASMSGGQNDDHPRGLSASVTAVDRLCCPRPLARSIRNEPTSSESVAALTARWGSG